MKRAQPILATAAVLALCGAPAAAQSLADLILFDGSNDQLVLFTDLDDDQGFYTAGEIRTLYDSTGGFEPYAFQTRVESGVFTAYWVESDFPFPNQPPPYDSQVFRAQDTNHNGTIEPAEVRLFRDIPNLDGPAFTNGMALTPDGAVWYTSRIFPVMPGDANGVFRARDNNNDGDANDGGEHDIMVDGQGMVTIQTNGGPVSIGASSFDMATRQNNGVAVFNNFDHSTIFRFEDRNGDGDVDDVNVGGISEAIVWLNATGETPVLDFNPDFANAGPGSDPRSIVISATSNGWLSLLATESTSGGDVVYAACDSSTTSGFAMNQFGEPINGLIFRCEDLNNDGDANDANEVTTFYDGSSSTSAPVILEKIVGMNWQDGWLYVAELNDNSTTVLHRMQDKTGDNRVTMASEMDTFIWDASQFLPDPPFPTPPGSPFVIDMSSTTSYTYDPCLDCVTYCTAKAGLVCGVPAIHPAGQSSASATEGFSISAGPARQNRSGILIYSNNGAAALPFQGGFLCLNPPLRRTVTVNSGGSNPCNGVFGIDMNAFASGNLGGNPQAFLNQIGNTIHTQFWGRDSVATGSFLSDGLEYVVKP